MKNVQDAANEDTKDYTQKEDSEEKEEETTAEPDIDKPEVHNTLKTDNENRALAWSYPCLQRGLNMRKDHTLIRGTYSGNPCSGPAEDEKVLGKGEEWEPCEEDGTSGTGPA